VKDSVFNDNTFAQSCVCREGERLGLLNRRNCFLKMCG